MKSMSLEEDVYTEIFSALRHPIRRRILKTLESKPQTYTELLKSLGIETGLLNYHLENLGSLIGKREDGKYSISQFGLAALGLTRRIEEPSGEQKEKVKLFGREFSKISFAAVIIVILLITNVYSLYLYQSSKGWYSERFREYVVLSSERFEDVLYAVEAIVEEGSLDQGKIGRLHDRVEEASIKLAMVSYLDNHHFDLWEETCESLELFEDLVEDLKFAYYKRAATEGNDTITLTSENLEKFSVLLDDLRSYHETVFPDSIIDEGNPWAATNYLRRENAFKHLIRFKKDVARAWLVIPTLELNLLPSPELQAHSMLVDSVGEKYYKSSMELEGIQFNYWEPENWLTCVTFEYHIQVSNYSATREIDFYFDRFNRFIRSTGVPPKDNLMPFNVTQQEAIKTALDRVTRESVEIEAEIGYVKSSVNNVSVNRYVWSVSVYHTKKNASSGSSTWVLIDLHSGEIIDIALISWISQS
jgi:DNA-binding transcriptional ArsR family regulator